MGIALRFNILINGGGQPRAFRSFGDSGADKRVRLFLAMGMGCTTSKDDIILQVQGAFLDLMLEPHPGVGVPLQPPGDHPDCPVA